MITVKPLAEAQVLVVGAGDLVNEILRLFVSYGEPYLNLSRKDSH